MIAAAVCAVLLAGCTPASAGPAQGPAAVRPTAPDASPASATPAPVPDPEKLAARLAKVSRTGIARSGIAVLADDGAVLADRGADRPLAPASTLKLLTTLAAVDTLGADHTFTTSVVSPSKGRIVLVGGGDPLLTDKTSTSATKPASLQALAVHTAEALAASGVTKVRLGYDDTLFSGPDFNPAWKSRWRGYLSRVTPLMVGEGRFDQWRSDPEPALTAATAFAKRLQKQGIRVTVVGRQEAPDGAATVASVSSARLSAVIARTLRLSDNSAAEVLARHVALATGRTPSFAGATAAITAWLKDHDLWDDGMVLRDGSGLSDRSRVTPSVLARALLLAVHTPELRAVADGLPVAGENGTLKDRFDDSSEAIARGNVRAKTGTLVGVASLAGYLTTADGARLVFAAMANGTAGQNTAYNWLDRSAAALVRCGCR